MIPTERGERGLVSIGVSSPRPEGILPVASDIPPRPDAVYSRTSDRSGMRRLWYSLARGYARGSGSMYRIETEGEVTMGNSNRGRQPKVPIVRSSRPVISI